MKTRLSRRLSVLAEMLPDTEALADIGTDHGGLLSYLVETGRVRRGIGVEITRGPYLRATTNINAMGYGDRVEIRLGDGLAPIGPGEVSACAIAGLGGQTIVRILDRSPEVAAGLDWLLLQPMTGAKTVRIYLQLNGWTIYREALAEDRGIIYEIILARRGETGPLSPLEAEFGPMILAERPPLFKQAVKRKILGLRDIVEQLEKSDSAESADRKGLLRERIREWEALI